MTPSSATSGSRSVPFFGREISLRLISAAVLAAVALACAWIGGAAAGIAVAVAVIIVHAEWIRITGDRLVRGAAGIGTVIVVIALGALVAGHMVTALIMAVIAIAFAALLSREPWRPAGVAYAAVLGFGLLMLRLSPEHGLTAILFLFAVVWGTDSAAYFAGRAIGGPKLWPAVSPKKTWAGSIGGLVAGIVCGLVVVAIAGLPVTLGAAVVAALVSIASEGGDLAESALKRHFGVKDSGNIIPGHGGLMDRVDGLIFGAGLAVLIGVAHGGAGNIAGGLLLW